MCPRDVERSRRHGCFVAANGVGRVGFRRSCVGSAAGGHQAWAKSIARANGHEKTAVCILDRESVSLSVIDTRNGAIKTKTTISRDSTGLIDWLSTAFGRNGSQPESLYLIGSRSELDAITGPLDEHLAVRVVASLDAQLALARGAALSGLTHVADDTAAEGRSRLASRVRVITVAAAVALAAMFVLSSAGGPNRLAASESQQAATPSTLASGGERRDDWGITARTVGTATITATARTDHDTDAVELPLPVLPFGIHREAGTAGSIVGAGEASTVVTVPDGANPIARTVTIALAPSLAGSVLGALDFLTAYPYGCTEQTLSSFLPNLLVTRALTDLKLAPTERLSALDRQVSRRQARYIQ